MAAQQKPLWGDPGVSEISFLQDNFITHPAAGLNITVGGVKNLSLQRAGFLKSLRFWLRNSITLSGYTTAPGKTQYGPLVALNRLRVTANGSIPLADLSFHGLTMLQEVQCQDGTFIAYPAAVAANNITLATDLIQYDAIGATGTFKDYMPFEIRMGIPLKLQNAMAELGLWLLQNQAVDTTVETQWNAAYNSVASNLAPWSAGTGIVGTNDAAAGLYVGRELYSIPSDPASYPPIAYAHQVIEQDNPITGSVTQFNMPRAGLVLRVIVVTLDSSGNYVDISDIKDLKWIYGANEIPIDMPGWELVEDFLLNFHHLPPKGMALLDFYRWGYSSPKLLKNAETTANLRIETTYITTTSGTQKIIMERLVKVSAR